MRGREGSWNFGFLGEVKIFLISSGLFNEGHYISLGEVTSFYPNFPILKCKISKFQKFLTAAPSFLNIHISRFKIHSGFQLDIDFNTESKFSCSRINFFSILSGHSKPTRPMKLISFFTKFGASRGPSKPFNQKSQSILCQCKQTRQLLVKIKKDLFVNKRPGVEHEGKF